MSVGSIDAAWHAPGRTRGPFDRLWAGRTRYLVGATCIVICTITLLPLALSVLASVKTTAEAAAVPPTYVPSELSLDSYDKLWSYRSGLSIIPCVAIYVLLQKYYVSGLTQGAVK